MESGLGPLGVVESARVPIVKPSEALPGEMNFDICLRSFGALNSQYLRRVFQVLWGCAVGVDLWAWAGLCQGTINVQLCGAVKGHDVQQSRMTRELHAPRSDVWPLLSAWEVGFSVVHAVGGQVQWRPQSGAGWWDGATRLGPHGQAH